ncbi:MAG: hypothetical protein K2K57_13585 [Oscillospiraceae bacterium]|nr:hypothetical protein [Oscillospiraceae bacterium]
MKKHIMTAAYSAGHFFVDLACAFLIFRSVYDGRGELLLYYNFCAFALQMPIGLLLDRFGKGHLAAALGCLLIVAAFPLSMLSGTNLMTAVVLGVGNSLFHLGGGVYVLDEYENSGTLGVFVSPGAIGLYLGTVWGKGAEFSTTGVMAVMIIWAAVFLLLPGGLRLENPLGAAAEVPENAPANMHENAPGKMPQALIWAAGMFTAVVVIRSFGGFAVSLPWKTAGAAALAAVFATASGKAAGGYLSDIFGKKPASAVSMGAAALLYIFSGNMIVGSLAVFLFNMTMPITLRAAADIMKGKRGFSFGLLTFGLFLGYIPMYLNGRLRISGGVMAALCVLSGALLFGGWKLMDNEAKKCQ